MSRHEQVIDAEIEGEILDSSQGHALAVRDSFLPAITAEAAAERYGAFKAFVQTQMKDGVDFGVIPGTRKPTLYKPGAEKICTLFGLSARSEMTDKIEDWAEGFIFYRYRVSLWRGDVLVAEAEGSCNSRERKYAKVTIYDVANTVLKMAFKRALVAAALVAGNASEFFTQDLEDIREVAPAAAEPSRTNALSAKQARAIERGAAKVGIDSDEASMKACGVPVDELQSGQADRLIKLLAAKAAQLEASAATSNPATADAEGAEPVGSFDADDAKDRDEVERREAEGRVIANAGGVTRDDEHNCWFVKSGKERQRYKVTRVEGGVHCSCPDFRFHGELPTYRCKHAFAVVFFAKAANEPGAAPKISERESGDLRSAFQDRGIPPAEWLIEHGIESGLVEDASPEVFNEAMAFLYS